MYCFWEEKYVIESGSEDQADGTVVHSMCVVLRERGDSRVILTIPLRALTESDNPIVDFCTAMNGRILMDQIPEDADEVLDGVVFKLTDGEDQKVLDRTLRSLREQTVQNGGGPPSAAPTYEANDPFGDGVRF